MHDFTLRQMRERCRPGDIGLTSNPQALGLLINFGQLIEQGDASTFGHVLILGHNPDSLHSFDNTIYESSWKIGPATMDKYIGQRVCIIRHAQMGIVEYRRGMEEVRDNFGQHYPYHRIPIHGFDLAVAGLVRVLTFGKVRTRRFRLARYMPMDWPVCSEYAAQFLLAGGLRNLGLPFMGWRGINPDHFDDARLRFPNLWITIFDGTLQDA